MVVRLNRRYKSLVGEGGGGQNTVWKIIKCKLAVGATIGSTFCSSFFGVRSAR